jgi:uncharacterized membrane protein YbhN (UPF0104 family)
LKVHLHYITIIKWVVLFSLVILLWQYVKVTDLEQVQAALIRAGSGFGWIILSTFVAYTLATVGWWYCLSDARTHISWSQLFMVRHICETVGMFTPASVAGGDMLKVVLLKPFAINPPTVVASVVISRLLMIISQICLLMSAVIWLFSNDKLNYQSLVAPSFATTALILVVLSVGLMGALRLRRSKYVNRVRKSAKWLRFRASVTEVKLETIRFFRQYPRELMTAFVLFTLHWIVGSLEFYIVLKLFGYPVSILDALLLDMGVIVVKAAGAFIPGQLGVEELGNKIMLSLIGIASIPLWISVSALRRTRQLFWILVGVLFYAVIAHKKKASS